MDSPAPGCATKSEIKLSVASRCPAPGPGPESQSQAGQKAISSLAPHHHHHHHIHTPLPDPGTGATYHSARPPNAAARPGRVRRALSLGRKRNRADRRCALTRRRLCRERGRRVPSGGGGGGICPTPEPGSKGGPGTQAATSLQGPRSRTCRGRRCPVPGHQLLSRRPGPGSRRPRGSAPLIPPACSPEKELRGGPRGKRTRSAEGVQGPEVRGGRGARTCAPSGGGDR